MIATSNYTTYYKKIIFDAIEIAYVDEGKGDQTLLMLHGLGNSLIGWEMNIATLSKHYRCIAIDLPGNGYSSKDESYPYSMEFFANAVASFINEMNLENVVLVGHSMGGQIAMKTAIMFPSLLQKMILIAPAGIEQFNGIEKSLMTAGMSVLNLFSSDESKLSQALNSSFYTLPESANSLINRLVDLLKLQPKLHYQKMVNACIQAMVNEPVWEEMPDIQCPALIIFGNMDNLIPNKMIHPVSTTSIAQEGAHRLAIGTYKMVLHAGHFVHWEKANEVNGLIHQFLD